MSPQRAPDMWQYDSETGKVEETSVQTGSQDAPEFYPGLYTEADDQDLLSGYYLG